MLWKNRRLSSNVIDQRKMAGPLGIGGLLLGAVVYFLMGGDPLLYLAQNSDSVQREEASPGEEQEVQFVSVVLADTEDVWNSVFKSNNLRYREPKLVLFRGRVNSACGTASRAVGPFYCPEDERVYLDLSFFQEMEGNLGAGGDFATAYVIAHEVGHHVQQLLGLHQDFATRAEGSDQSGRNRLSVKLELQADCLAGVWAKDTDKMKQVIEPGDIDEAMNAATAVGDDRLQRRSQGVIVPDSFTHGSSAQRLAAFRQGYSEGDPQTCLNSYSLQ